MRLARFISGYATRYKGWLALGLLMMVVLSSMTVVLVSLIEPLFGEVLLAESGAPGDLLGQLSGGDPEESAEADGTKWGISLWLEQLYERSKGWFGVDSSNVLYYVPLLVLGVFTLLSVARFIGAYSFKRVGLQVTTEIRNDLYRYTLGQSSRFHSRHSSTEVVSRVINDVGLIQTTVSDRLVDLVTESIRLVWLIALLVTNHARFAFVCLVGVPIILLPIVRFGRGMRKTSYRSQERMADLAEVVAEGARGHRVVKAFGMEEFEDRRFGKATHRHLRVNLWAQLLASLSSPVIETVAIVGAAGLLIYAGQQIREGVMTSAQFIGFLVNLVYLYDPLRKLNKANLALQQSFAAGHRVLEFLTEPNEIQDPTEPVELSGLGDGIRFEGVGFAYGDQPVLRDIDLAVAPGQVVAFVGPSGGGKSTLVNLVPRFFDPNAGRVLLGGVDLRELRLKDLRRQIALVTQETFLFDDTIRNNIASGRAEVGLDVVRRAAEAAHAAEFIEALPDGYESRIGEAGQSLSGGQRQRLAIARALLKDAPILILDEATSQLDSESEAKVQRALANLMAGRTTLVIAHRLSTVTSADRIVVLKEGRIVDQGTHEELVRGGGLYKELYDLQFDG